MDQTLLKPETIRKMPFLIDTHCHLDFDVFEKDRDQVLERAFEKGITHMITVSTRIKKFSALLTLIERHPELYCSIGTHPINAEEEGEFCASDILGFSSHPKLVAIGECGLDYHYGIDKGAIQKKVFVEHIRAAQSSQLPLIIHTRNADEDMGELLQYHHKEQGFPFVMHCYSSGKRLASIALDLGGFISFSGIVTFKNAASVQEIASFVPMDRILVETDAPYLAPVPYRGIRNEPGFVKEIAVYLAKLRALSFEDFAMQTNENALNLFKKMR